MHHEGWSGTAQVLYLEVFWGLFLQLLYQLADLSNLLKILIFALYSTYSSLKQTIQNRKETK